MLIILRDGPSPNYFSILKAANNLRYPHLQISKLQLQSQRLEDEKVMLLEKNAQNISDIENLRQQLAELTKENESREVLATKEKNKVSGVQGWMMMMLMKMVVVAGS